MCEIMFPSELFQVIISFYDNLSYRFVCRKWSLMVSEKFLREFASDKNSRVIFKFRNHMKKIPNSDFIRLLIKNSDVKEIRKKYLIICMNEPRGDFNDKELLDYIRYDADNYIKGFEISILATKMEFILIRDSPKCLKYLREKLGESDFVVTVNNSIFSINNKKHKMGEDCLIYLFEECSGINHYVKHYTTIIFSSYDPWRIRKILNNANEEIISQLKHFFSKGFSRDREIHDRYFSRQIL